MCTRGAPGAVATGTGGGLPGIGWGGRTPVSSAPVVPDSKGGSAGGGSARARQGAEAKKKDRTPAILRLIAGGRTKRGRRTQASFSGNMPRMRAIHASVLAVALLSACKGSGSGTGGSGGGAAAGATAVFDLTADLTSPAHFFDAPYPSDLRLTAAGTPDLTGLLYPSFLQTIAGLQKVAMEHPGFPVVPVAYFHFDAALGNLDVTQVIPAAKTSPVLLVDVDPTSKDRGALFPTVATVPAADGWLPDGNVLAVAQRPGFVLHPTRKYAFVVLRSLKDGSGLPLGSSATLEQLKAGTAPAGAKGAAALALYQPLWDTLKTLGVDQAQVAAATVFTTGDVVAETADLASKLAAKYPVTLDNLAFNKANFAVQNRYCELIGSVTYPQFQVGKPPFDSEGSFDFSDGGLPAKQRDEPAPVAITIPRGPMPVNGFPLVTYFHGSGGYSTSLADRGAWRPTSDPSQCAPATAFTPATPLDGWNGTASCNAGDPLCVMGCNTPGQGPAYVLAPFGIAMAGSALPVNPERLPGATDTAYLNLNNLSAMRDTFRQGIIEQHLLLDALSKLTIDPSMLAACPGVSLPAGATAYKFDTSHVLAQGQSMGGMYTNLITAAEPRLTAAVATGAGGYWSHFILITPLVPTGAVGTLLLGTQAELTFLHPGLSLFETAAEAVDPMVSMPRVARRPLPGSPSRPVYEPVGKGDSYFPEATYDAMATAYGHRETGAVVWPTMQPALALEGDDGILPYSVVNDLTSESGAKYTGAVVQYKGDGVYDPHALYSQLDAVKYQYGCFFSTFLQSGTAVVPAPAALGTACPTK